MLLFQFLNEAVAADVVAKTVAEFGGIDVLINNAQASASGVTIEKHTLEQFNLAMYSGLYSTFYYMKACYPYLKETTVYKVEVFRNREDQEPVDTFVTEKSQGFSLSTLLLAGGAALILSCCAPKKFKFLKLN